MIAPIEIEEIGIGVGCDDDENEIYGIKCSNRCNLDINNSTPFDFPLTNPITNISNNGRHIINDKRLTFSNDLIMKYSSQMYEKVTSQLRMIDDYKEQRSVPSLPAKPIQPPKIPKKKFKHGFPQFVGMY